MEWTKGKLSHKTISLRFSNVKVRAPYLAINMKQVIFIISLLILGGCRKKFEPEEWKQNSETTLDNPRWTMTEDLQSKLKEQFPTLGEIRRQLGEPRFEETGNNEKYLFYFLGHNSGFQIDPDYLVVKVSSDSLFVDSWVEQH